MKHICTTLALLLLTGCNHTATTDEAEAKASECLRANRVSGFSSIDNRHVFVRERPGTEGWLLTTTGGCRDLEFTNSLAISSRLTCVRKYDTIYASEFGNRHVDRCMILSIEMFENQRAAQALIDERRKPVAETESE